MTDDQDHDKIFSLETALRQLNDGGGIVSVKYRDHLCKTIEMTGFYHTSLRFSELGPDIYLSN